VSTDRSRVLVILLAGGAGSRLGPLTATRAKPSLPFGGMFRLVDVALSNIAHSGLDDVWVLVQYEPHALNEHLSNGRPWDLDRTHGGLRVLPPFQVKDQADDVATVAAGNADALVQHRRLIAEHGTDVVVTMSADHVYRLDLRDVLHTHAARGAALTIVTTDPHPDDDPTRFAWVTADDDGAVTGFDYKPDTPTGDRVCTEVFAFDATTLLRHLDALPGGEDGVDHAGDYGESLLPAFVAGEDVVEHRLDGYWRDIGTLRAYHRAHLELIDDDPPFDLDDRSWPLLTGSITGGPARVSTGATIERVVLSPGVRVAGTVRDSVLGRHVTVEAGATLERCVVLDDAVIRAGATVHDAIVNIATTVGPRSTPITGPDADPDVAVFDG